MRRHAGVWCGLQPYLRAMSIASTFPYLLNLKRPLIILTDISIGSVEEVLISVQLVLQQRPSEFLLHEALALRGVLPIGEADFLHDIVDLFQSPVNNFIEPSGGDR